MIPYTIIKEVNPDEVKGSATGGINFLTFGVTALIGPFFADAFGKGIAATHNHVAHFRDSGLFWMASIVLAILLSMFLPETGHETEKANSGAADMKPFTSYLHACFCQASMGTSQGQDPDSSAGHGTSGCRGAGPPRSSLANPEAIGRTTSGN